MSKLVPENWTTEDLDKFLVSLPKSRHPSGISDENGYYNFYVCSSNVKRSFKCDITEPSVLFSTGGEAVIHYATGKYSYSTDVWATKYSKNLTNEFVFRFLDLNISKIKSLGFQGSGIKHLDKDYIKKLKITYPPLPEQKKITSILTSVDEVIEKTQLQINKLQDLKKGTMNELLTKGIGHTEFKDSELGRIPVSWEVASLGSFVLDQKSGASLSPSDFCEDGFGVIPKKAVQFGGRIVLGDKLTFCTNEFADNNRKNIVSNEYVIAVQRDLVPSGPSIGLMGMLMEGAEFILAQGVYGYLLDSRLNPLFLSLISNTDWYRGVMRKIFVGSTQIHIRSTEFLEVVIPIPPVEEQNDIAERINMMESQILLKQKIKHKFSSLKNSLMQDLLTGRVRVSL